MYGRAMGHGFLTPARARLVQAIRELAALTTSTDVIADIGASADETFENDHVTQLLVRKTLKQGDFASALADALETGSTSSATALSRTLLEESVVLCWAAVDIAEPDDADEAAVRARREERKTRTKRLLKAYLNRLQNKLKATPGGALPDAEQQALASLQCVRLAPGREQMLTALDAEEERQAASRTGAATTRSSISRPTSATASS